MCHRRCHDNHGLVANDDHDDSGTFAAVGGVVQRVAGAARDEPHAEVGAGRVLAPL